MDSLRTPYERYTDRARRAVIEAEEEARRDCRETITTADLLLGLMHDSDSVAGRVLHQCGLVLLSARAVAAGLYAGMSDRRPAEPLTRALPWSKGTADILREGAQREALTLVHPYIGTEHLLLAMVNGPRCDVHEVLEALEIDPAHVADAVRAALGKYDGARAAVTGPRIFVVSAGRAVAKPELPVPFFIQRGGELPERDHAVEIAPGVRVALIDTGDQEDVDGTPYRGARIAVWTETAPGS